MNQRSVTAILSGALFLVSTISGLALFFHYRPALFHDMHKWLSLAFVVICIYHVVLNRTNLFKYLRRPLLAGLLIATLAGSFWYGFSTEKNQQPNANVIIQKMMDVPFEKIAPSINVDISAALSNLQKAGVDAKPEQTLRDICAIYHVSPVKVLEAASR